jgi:hypothetical protein
MISKQKSISESFFEFGIINVSINSSGNRDAASFMNYGFPDGGGINRTDRVLAAKFSRMITIKRQKTEN